MARILMVVDAPHWACMNVARGVQKHSEHRVDIAFWWYKTKYHSFDPRDYDINYIHSGAVVAYPERWSWVQSFEGETKWILGYRGASAMRKLGGKIGHPIWSAYSCSNLELMKDVPEPKYKCQAGVDLDIFKPAPLPDDFKILWAGTPHAGAKKFNHVRELGRLFPHMFAGPARKTDPWYGEVKGRKPHEMPEFYSQGSVYVSCSSREGSPLPPREAAAMGRPVLAVRAGDLVEWMPEWNLVDTWQELIPKIEDYRDEKAKLVEDGAMFHELARRLFDYRVIVKQYDRMFDEVLEL